jgi:hypothetical protein
MTPQNIKITENDFSVTVTYTDGDWTNSRPFETITEAKKFVEYLKGDRWKK